jgi:hypothetical protein
VLVDPKSGDVAARRPGPTHVISELCERHLVGLLHDPQEVLRLLHDFGELPRVERLRVHRPVLTKVPDEPVAKLPPVVLPDRRFRVDPVDQSAVCELLHHDALHPAGLPVEAANQEEASPGPEIIEVAPRGAENPRSAPDHVIVDLPRHVVATRDEIHAEGQADEAQEDPGR